ncbi:hypothetical protein ABN028_19755 [Actinopolymorpha sp. B17G11]|uniref:hypothetical protein n=1 Tax=Actinopolymorpha sp. B17G11 TaxID=3160861 RepID=UPI0032E36A6C
MTPTLHGRRGRAIPTPVTRLLVILPSDQPVTVAKAAILAHRAGMEVDDRDGVPYVGPRPVGAMLRTLRRNGWVTVRRRGDVAVYLRTPAGEDAAKSVDET